MADLESWDGQDRRHPGNDRRRTVPQRFGFFIHKTDGSVLEVPCRALAQVNFEEHFKAGLNAGITQLPATRSLWLAYECERLYVNNNAPEFAEWVKSVETLEEWSEALPFGREASAIKSPA